MKTQKIRNLSKGFTLIEVLIVVIILAVLAALIVPKLLGASENAYIAEATQQLGAMQKAQNVWMDMINVANDNTLQVTGQAVGVCGAGAATPCANEATWAALGLQAPVPGRAHFSYACTATQCTATRVDAANARVNGNTIIFDYQPAVHGYVAGAVAGQCGGPGAAGNVPYAFISVEAGCRAG